MRKRISTMIAITFLIFAVGSAQQRNEQYSSRISDSLLASDGRSSKTHRQAIVYPRGKLYGLRIHRSNTAHFVNGSNTNGAYVKVYGEANPSKTDEHLLDIETQTQLLPVRGHIASSESSGGNGHELSLSGYGPPGGEPEIPEVAVTDEQAESATEMQAPLRPNVENPYDSIPAATEAEQQAITAEISSTSSAKEESGVPSVTDTEQAIISSEAATSATETGDGLRETEEGGTESALTATEFGVGSEASAEGSIAIETTESMSIGTEAVGISTTEGIKIEDESRFEGYGTGDEIARTEGIPETEVKETPGEGIVFTPSESATGSSISDVITQTESVKEETGAEDLGYGVPPKTLEEQPTAEETLSSIAQTLPEVEATITSGAEETSYSVGEETRYTETETTSSETEVSTDQVTKEVTSEPLTSAETSSTSSHLITEEAEVASPPVIEPAGAVPGYETLGEPEVGKEGLPGIDIESTSQLAKSTEEATTLSEKAEETEITSEKAPEDMETEPEGLKDSTELVTASAEVGETTGFLKEASLPHVEQPSGYGEVAPEYTVERKEAEELQKSEETEAPAEEKVVSDETPAISTEVFMISGSAENGATELPSESKEYTIASEEIIPVEETPEIPKSGEGLAGYGEILSTPESDAEATELQKVDEESTIALESSESPPILPTDFYETTLQTEFIETEAGPGEQPSSTEILTESGITDIQILERTTQPSEWETKTNELTSMFSETSSPESSIIETKFDSATTAFNEQIITGEPVASDETKGSDEQPVGYGEPLVVPHESTTETEKTESLLPEKISDESIEETTSPLTPSQDLATSEAITTTGEVAGEAESASTIRIEHTDTQTGAEDIGYGGGGEEAVTEKEHIGDTSITDTSVPRSDLESTTLGEEILISSSITSLPEKISDESIEETTIHLTPSQDAETSEAVITTSEVAEETESASAIQTEQADTQIGAGDFGYGGGGEEAVTEKEHVDDTGLIDTSIPKSNLESTTLGEEVLISITATGAEEITESPILSTELRESMESVVESTEQFTNGEVETNEKVSGYDIYPSTEAKINELSPSDEQLTVPQEIDESTLEVNEITSTEESVSLSSSASESAESISTSRAISEETEYAEVPVSETASVQMESSKVPVDTHDFGYGEKLEEVTEEKLTAETQAPETSIAVTEPVITTQEQIIEITAESSQQPSATETSSAESSITISSETTDSATESKTSPQYSEETRDIAESTLMQVVTSEVEIPVPYGEEAPQIIAMTKIMKTGPSAITASEILTTEGTKEVGGTGAETPEKSSLETMKEFEVETTKSEETTEVRNGMDTISSEIALVTSSEELVTTTAGITETESYSRSNEDVSVKIPMGPADFGYGGEIEDSSSILPGIELVTTTISELPLTKEQYSHIETSATPEPVVTAEYSSTEIFSESASKSSEEYASATFPSVSSEALTESVTQTMLATHEESIASGDIHDQQDIPSKIPTGPEDFGYGDSVQEQSNVASNPRAYSDAIKASNKGIIFENQERTRQKHFDGPVISKTVSSNKPLGKIDNSSRRKWKPFTIDCKKEVDEKGDLCQEWARAGLCATHRPTMFLFCRRTCLCIGPPLDLIR